MQPAVKPPSCSHEVIADGHPPAAASSGRTATMRPTRASSSPCAPGVPTKPPSCPGPSASTSWDAETQHHGVPVSAVVGEGTQQAGTALKKGDSFQLTGPMGNGFDIAGLTRTVQKDRCGGRRHRHRPHVSGGAGAGRRRAASRTSSSASGMPPTAWRSTAPSPTCVKVSTDTGAGGLPRLCHPAVRPGGLRRRAGVRPHRHDEKRRPPLRREKAPPAL